MRVGLTGKVPSHSSEDCHHQLPQGRYRSFVWEAVATNSMHPPRPRRPPSSSRHDGDIRHGRQSPRANRATRSMRHSHSSSPSFPPAEERAKSNGSRSRSFCRDGVHLRPSSRGASCHLFPILSARRRSRRCYRSCRGTKSCRGCVPDDVSRRHVLGDCRRSRTTRSKIGCCRCCCSCFSSCLKRTTSCTT
jgi:hypothetical protein